jgi:outer membrane receptor protein involved in Fe transport
LEFELNTPLFTPGLNLTLGYAYTYAKLTKSFCLPDGDGSGAPNGFIPCGIQGINGEAMPGSPKSVVSATLSYSQPIPGNGHLIYTLNENYKSSIPLALSSSVIAAPAAPPYALMNGSITWAMQQHWRIGAFSNNLLNRRAIYAEQINPLLMDTPLAQRYTVSTPREIGIRVSYDF